MSEKALVNSLARHGANLFTPDDPIAERYGAFHRALIARDKELAGRVSEKIREHLHSRVEVAGRRLDRAVVRRMDWPTVIPG